MSKEEEFKNYIKSIGFKYNKFYGYYEYENYRIDLFKNFYLVCIFNKEST